MNDMINGKVALLSMIQAEILSMVVKLLLKRSHQIFKCCSYHYLEYFLQMPSIASHVQWPLFRDLKSTKIEERKKFSFFCNHD